MVDKAQVNKLRLALDGIFDGQIATVDSFQVKAELFFILLL